MGRVVSEAAAAPLPLAEAKAFLRIASSEEDALLAGLLRSAIATCEAFTGRLMIARDVTETVPAAPGWVRLSAAPVGAIGTVAAVDGEGEETALAPSGYAVDIDAAGEGWVRAAAGGSRIRVGYRAGLAEDWNGVPEPLRQGVVRLAAHLYAEREGDPPAAVTALWRPWRRMRLT